MQVKHQLKLITELNQSMLICHNVIQQSKGNDYFNISYIDINPPIPCNLTAPVTVKMCNLSEKISNTEQWYSSRFFTIHEGYQMYLNLYTTGYDKSNNDHLSVFIHLMKGPHDDKLQQLGHWPLRGTFIIKLLNQYSDHHYSKNITFSKSINCDKCIQRVGKGDMTVGIGFPQFLPHRDITDYLTNDCLYFEIFCEDTVQIMTTADPPDPESDQPTQGWSFVDLLYLIVHMYQLVKSIVLAARAVINLIDSILIAIIRVVAITLYYLLLIISPAVCVLIMCLACCNDLQSKQKKV